MTGRRTLGTECEGMIEFKKVTTRAGDQGESGLANGERLRKDDLLFETMGTVDELSSFLGVARAAGRRLSGPSGDPLAPRGRLDAIVDAIQRNLLAVGAQLATPSRDPHYAKTRFIADRHVEELEAIEAEYLAGTKIGGRFVQPGELSLASAHFDAARSVCRRAERRIVSCMRERGMEDLAPALRYVNRLSDFLFVVARHLDQTDGGEVP